MRVSIYWITPELDYPIFIKINRYAQYPLMECKRHPCLFEKRV